MFRRAVLRLLVLTLILAIIVKVEPGIRVHGGFFTFLWIAFLFSLVNLIIGPILRLLSLPLIILTLGLFLFVINAVILAITAALSSKLDINNFGSAVLAGFLIALFSWIAEMFLPLRRKDDERRPVR